MRIPGRRTAVCRWPDGGPGGCGPGSRYPGGGPFCLVRAAGLRPGPGAQARRANASGVTSGGRCLAALAILQSEGSHPPRGRKPASAQVIAPAQAAELIDRLRAAAVTLIYNPATRALRTGLALRPRFAARTFQSGSPGMALRSGAPRLAARALRPLSSLPNFVRHGCHSRSM